MRRAAPFDPNFIARHPLLWPLARAAGALGRFDGFPPVEALANVFDPAMGEPPVRFAHAAPRRRRGAPLDPRALYDARIAIDREVPTRKQCWHDLLNALVWGTFPRSKYVLHVRQHQAISRRLTPGARTLPATRSRELDALALVDEGGVVLLARDASHARALRENGDSASVSAELASGTVEAVIFGHAIYESLVLGVRPAVVAAVVVQRGPAGTNLLGPMDDDLARMLENRALLRSPDEFVRIDLGLHRSRAPWPSDALQSSLTA